MGALSHTDLLSVAPGVEIVATTQGRILVRAPRGNSVLAGIARDRLEAVLEAAKGGSSVDALIGRGADVRMLEILVATGVLERRSDGPVSGQPIAVIGNGRLAAAILRALGNRGVVNVESVDFEPRDWLDPQTSSARASSVLGEAIVANPDASTAGKIREIGSRLPALVIAAVEGAAYEAILGLQRAFGASGSPILFASVESGEVVVGPLFVAGATACFACRQLTACFGAAALSDEAVGTLPFLRSGTLADEERPVLEAVAGAIAAAVPEPVGLLTRALSFSRTGGQTRLLDVAPLEGCPHCGIAATAGPPGPLRRSAVVARAVAADLAAAQAIHRATREATEPYRTVGIIGGGTAGFLTALTLRRKRPELAVTLIESSRIPILGVGEATTPYLVDYLHNPQRLGLDVVDFYRRVRPSWKIGISFYWGLPGDYGFQFPFQFGSVAEPLRYRGNIDSYCLGALLQEQKKAPIIDRGDGTYENLLGQVPVAYHLDNRRFVAYLREEAVRAGVVILDREIADVALTERGDEIAHLVSKDGERIAFDLYVDCTGFRSILIEKLGSRYLSYGSSLFNDAAVMGNIPTTGTIEPYTLAETMDHGWCWKIPFEDSDHRGYVFSTAFADNTAAIDELRRKNPGISDPWSLRFRSGRHEDFFLGNVVALGNSYAFVEPLESTAIHMLLVALNLLTDHFPGTRSDDATKRALSRRLNALWDELRGFLAIHYRYNRKLDTPYWRECRASAELGTAEARVALFAERAPLVASSGLFGQADPFFYESGRRDFFSQEYVYDILLAGQQVPARWAEPAMSRAAYEARLARMHDLVRFALPLRQALELVHARPEMIGG